MVINMVLNKLKVGDEVKIIKKDSRFYGIEGKIISQGNGSCWQVEVFKGVGVYLFDYELEKIK
jgi:hypothetical protein